MTDDGLAYRLSKPSAAMVMIIQHKHAIVIHEGRFQLLEPS